MRRWSAHIAAATVAVGTLLGVANGAGTATVPVVPVGSRPVAVAVDAATGTVYVANSGAGTVSVIPSASCNAVTRARCRPVATAKVGGSPVAVAVDVRTDTVYVADASKGTVAVLNGRRCDAKTRTRCRPVAQARVGKGISALADDERLATLYVARRTGNTVSILDTRYCDATNTSRCRVRGTVAVGKGPDGLAIDARTHTLYVTNAVSNTLSVINIARCDAATRARCRPVASASTGEASTPAGIAVNESTNSVYVAGRTSSQNGGEDYPDAEVLTAGLVTVIDGGRCDATRTSHCAPVANAAVGDEPVGIALDERSNMVYVTNATDSSGSDVSVIDGAACDAAARAGCLATWSVPVRKDPAGLAVLPSSATRPASVYVADKAASALSVLGEPGPPRAVRALPAGARSVVVSWKAASGRDLPINTLGAGATPGQFAYRVIPSPRCPSCSGLEVTQPVDGSGGLVPDLSTVVTGLKAHQRYSFRVFATNEAGPGTSSAASKAVAVSAYNIRRPLLGLVARKWTAQRLSLVGGSGADWHVVLGRLPAGLRLSRSGLLAGVPRVIGTRSVTLGTRTDAGRGPETTAAYFFTVSSPAPQGSRGAPAVPTDVTVRRVSDGQVTLSWRSPSSWGSSSPKSFLVTSSRRGTGGSSSTTVSARTLVTTINDLYDGLPVSFTVAAVNSAGRSSGPSRPSSVVTPQATTALSSTVTFATEPSERGCFDGYLGCFTVQQNFFANAANSGPAGVPFVWGQNVLVFYSENFQWYVQSEAQVWVESSSEYGVYWYGPSNWFNSARLVTSYPAKFTVTTQVEQNKLVFSNSVAGHDFWSWSVPSLGAVDPYDSVDMFPPTSYWQFFDPQSVVVGYANGEGAAFARPTAGSVASDAALANGSVETGFDCPVDAAVTSTAETSDGLQFSPVRPGLSFHYAKGSAEEGATYGAGTYPCAGSRAPTEPMRIPASALSRALAATGDWSMTLAHVTAGGASRSFSARGVGAGGRHLAR